MNKIISVFAVLIVAVLILVSVNKKDDKKVVVLDNATSTNPGAIQISDLKIENGVYNINPSDAKLVWTGRKVILKNWVDSGIVNVKEASFEIKDNAVISNKFVIDMASIAGKTTGAGDGQDKLTTHLKSADFFDVAQFPTSTFVAKEFSPYVSASTSKAIANSKKFIVKGDMTIKDVTEEIAIPVTFISNDGLNVKAIGSIDLDRTLWNVRYRSGKFFDNLGNNVIDDMFNISFEMNMSLGTTASSTPIKK